MGSHSAGDDDVVTDDADESRGFFRRHSLLTAFLAVVTVLALSVAVFAFLRGRRLSPKPRHQLDPAGCRLGQVAHRKVPK